MSLKSRIKKKAKSFGGGVKRVAKAGGRLGMGLLRGTPLGGFIPDRGGADGGDGEIRSMAARRMKRQAGAGQIEYTGNEMI